MPARRPRGALPLPVLCLWLACGPAERTAAVPVSTGTIALEIGVLEGPAELTFGRITGVARLADGSIAVADAQNNDVRLFGPDGTFLYRVARDGSGPGEVRGPCCLAVDAEGRLWMRDAFNARYNIYRPGDDAAPFVTAVRIAHGAAGFQVATTFDAGGRLVDVGMAPGGFQSHVLRFTRDPDGSVVREDTIPAPPADQVGMHSAAMASGAVFYLWQPFGPRHLVAHAHGGGWADAVSSRYSVLWKGPDGSFEHRIEGLHDPPPLSPGERQVAEEQIGRDRARTTQLPFGVPTHKPPLRHLHFDRDGRLWVELGVPEGSPRLADVWDASGTLVARAEWPGHVDLRFGHLDGEQAVGVGADSLGVQRVVVIRWDPPVMAP